MLDQAYTRTVHTTRSNICRTIRVATGAQATRVARAARATRVARTTRVAKVSRSRVIATSAKAERIAKVCQDLPSCQKLQFART